MWWHDVEVVVGSMVSEGGRCGSSGGGRGWIEGV